MSFDIDPEDKYERILCSHPESDSLFEVFSRAEFAQICNGESIDDVTRYDWAEKVFKEQQQNNNLS